MVEFHTKIYNGDGSPEDDRRLYHLFNNFFYGRKMNHVAVRYYASIVAESMAKEFRSTMEEGLTSNDKD